MTPPIFNNETKQSLENLKLTNEEKQSQKCFAHLSEAELDNLRETIFTLSLLLLKSDSYEST
jgi:hypothetical protein